jgi:Putative helicase
MVGAAVGVSRKIWRQICRQIFRENSNPSLPLPARPQGQPSGAVPGMSQTSPEPDPVIENLIRQILCRLSKHDNFYVGMAVISRLRDLVGDLPASANHHHSEPYGLLRHSLEVTLKMLDDFESAVAESSLNDDTDSQSRMSEHPVWQCVCFLAGLCHDLGKLMEMEVHDIERHWCPFKETYRKFCRNAKTEPVFRWRQDRERGRHALFSPMVIHHLLTAEDVDYLGCDGLAQLLRAVTGTHKGNKSDQSTPLGRTLTKLDQKNVDEAAPDWMLKRPDSKVNQFIRALRALIENGELQVNSVCAPIYVMDNRAAVVVPASVLMARDFLRRENIKLPPNVRLYDLLVQSKLVEADGGGQCVRRIIIAGTHGPAELRVLIFRAETLIPEQMIDSLPNVAFELKPQEPKQAVSKTESNNIKATEITHGVG